MKSNIYTRSKVIVRTPTGLQTPTTTASYHYTTTKFVRSY